MSTIATVLRALGRGDLQRGAYLASLAVLFSVPVWVALAIVLAIGPGK